MLPYHSDQAARFLLAPPRPTPAAAAAVLALPAGYLYWDYASHFETTDDAYIAARQFAIAPEVSGYITAVPLTDNQHVAAGGVIARIDDRNYRAALAQAKAQVAAARANIEDSEARIAVQQAQISANQAQADTAQAAAVDHHPRAVGEGVKVVEHPAGWSFEPTHIRDAAGAGEYLDHRRFGRLPKPVRSAACCATRKASRTI
jgi:hypothetical protein